jgi:hypothetical protein
MYKGFQSIALGLVLLMLHSVALASTVTAKLDRSQAVVGETVTLVLQTDNTDQALDTDLSVLQADFEILDQRSETQMSIVNGARSASVRLVITLEPKRAGNLLIPSLQFKGAASQPLTLRVQDAPQTAPGEPEPVFIEVSLAPDTGPYYVLSQISLVVRIFYQANLTEAAINPPEPSQASVRLLDEVPFQAVRNGVNYRVLERHYAIFPERSGTLNIPTLQLTGRLTERSAGGVWQPRVRGRRVRVESDPITVEISPKPASYTGDVWIPARRLTLSQKISDNDKLHVGEPVTRTIIMDAVGLEENMLEEPQWPETQDLRIYPDQPQGISRDDGQWVLGHKEFRYAIVPEKAGELVLPEIKVDWWDTNSNQQRTAMLPEFRIEVLPSENTPAVVNTAPASPDNQISADAASPGLALTSGKASVMWQWATAAFALLWLLTLYFYLRRPRQSVAPQSPGGSRTIEESALLKELQSACKNNDASIARNRLAQWIRNYAPTELRGSMRGFGAGCDDAKLRLAIVDLDIAGFSPDSTVSWQGEQLWSAFKNWRSQPAASKNQEQGEQPDLYA